MEFIGMSTANECGPVQRLIQTNCLIAWPTA